MVAPSARKAYRIIEVSGSVSADHTPPISCSVAQRIADSDFAGILVVEGAHVRELNRPARELLSVEAHVSSVSDLPEPLRKALPQPGKSASVTISHGAPASEPRTLELRALPQRDQDPSGYRIIVISDRTLQSRTEAQLRERTAQLESTIESLPFDFWMNDRENRTVMQNPFSRALWGDKTGTAMEEVTPDESILVTWRDSNARALAGETVSREIRYLIDGVERTFRNIVAPVKDGDAITGILGINVDITDYKRALSDREMLLRELHHRVKNHLQLVLSMVSILRGRTDLTAEAALKQLEDRVHAIYLVHEQLYRAPGFESVELATYLDDIVAGLQTGYGRQITCMMGSSLGTPPIERAIPLGLILTELLVNALKHGSEEQPVTVAAALQPAEREDGAPMVEITVTNGVRVDDRETSSRAQHPIGGTTFVEYLAQQIGAAIGIDTDTDSYRVTVRVGRG